MKTNLLKNIIKKINKNIFSLTVALFLVFVFIQKFNLAENTYYIINKNYYTRLADSYEKKFFSGFCKKESHGYIIYIKTGFVHTAIPKIINFDEVRRKPYWIFFDTGSKISNNKVIVLNYDKALSKLKKKIDISKYKILDNFQDRCFFLEKYD